MLTFLARRWFILAIFIGLAVVLTFPVQAALVLDRVQTTAITFVVLLLMSLGLETRKLWESVRRPGPALTATLITYGLSPLACYVAAMLVPPEYAVGVIIAGSVPCTMASATIWTRLAGGNESVSLLVTMITNLLVFVFTAFWLKVLTGQEVAFDVMEMVTRLLMVVVAPIFLGQILRIQPRVGERAIRHKRLLGVICRVLILSIILKSGGAAQEKLVSQGKSLLLDPQLLVVFAVCAAVHLLLLHVGLWIGLRLFTPKHAIAIAFAGSQKTLPVGVFLIDVYFAAAPLSIVPMLFYHVGQLVIDTFIAEKLYYHLIRPHENPDPAEDSSPER